MYILARGGKVILITDSQGDKEVDDSFLRRLKQRTCQVYSTNNFYNTGSTLSYYVAVLKGTDVDQPRNLAKSVTVE